MAFTDRYGDMLNPGSDDAYRKARPEQPQGAAAVEHFKRIYLAGPLSADGVAGTRAALEVADFLLTRGIAPFVPHFTMFWHLVSPKPYSDWMAYDEKWLSVCNGLIRVGNELNLPSPGADREEELARAKGIPVFHSLDEFLRETGIQ